jgi:hypothetical protein
VRLLGWGAPLAVAGEGLLPTLRGEAAKDGAPGLKVFERNELGPDFGFGLPVLDENVPPGFGRACSFNVSRGRRTLLQLHVADVI